MARYFDPGEPVDLDVDAGEQMFHAQAFFAELSAPIHMDVAAAGESEARERVIDLCRSTFAGLSMPPQVAVFSLEDWLAR